jgi:hypothetical protein
MHAHGEVGVEMNIDVTRTCAKSCIAIDSDPECDDRDDRRHLPPSTASAIHTPITARPSTRSGVNAHAAAHPTAISASSA